MMSTEIIRKVPRRDGATVLEKMEARATPGRRLLVRYWPDNAAKRRAAELGEIPHDLPNPTIQSVFDCDRSTAVTFSKGVLCAQGPDVNLTIPYVARLEVSIV